MAENKRLRRLVRGVVRAIINIIFNTGNDVISNGLIHEIHLSKLVSIYRDEIRLHRKLPCMDGVAMYIYYFICMEQFSRIVILPFKKKKK